MVDEKKKKKLVKVSDFGVKVLRGKNSHHD